MNLRQIEVFHAIMRFGSINQAAKILNVSQPTLSQTLKHTEDRLGYLLFRRVKGRLVPTEEAHVLFDHAERVVEMVEAVNMVSANLSNTLETELSIGTVPALSFSAVPKAVQLMMAPYHRVHFRFKSVGHQNYIALLDRKVLDVALVFCPETGRSPYVTSYLSEGYFSLLTSQDIPFDQAADLSHYLNERSYVSITESGPLGNILDQAVREQGVALKSQVSVDSYHAAASMVEHGNSVAILDKYTAEAFSGQTLKAYPLNVFPNFKIGAVYSDLNTKVDVIEVFLECLRRVL